jgi:Holliday junction resolvase
MVTRQKKIVKVLLTKEERSKINKANRARGYRVERNDVIYHKERGIFAFRFPQKHQRKDFSTWDIIVCKSTGTEIHQCKDRKDLMGKLEKENHIRTVTYWGMIPVLCYRVPFRGLFWEVLTLDSHNTL